MKSYGQISFKFYITCDPKEYTNLENNITCSKYKHNWIHFFPAYYFEFSNELNQKKFIIFMISFVTYLVNKIYSVY